MEIEGLKYEQEEVFVGITEIKMNQQVTKQQVIDFAQECPEGVLAAQFLDSSLVAGSLHLLSAAQNALNAWNGEYNISRSLGVEVILYASGQHQIGIALNKLGVREDSENVALVVLGESEDTVRKQVEFLVGRVGAEKDEQFLMDGSRYTKIMSFFGITEEEIRALVSSDSFSARADALVSCVTSRVSLVGLSA